MSNLADDPELVAKEQQLEVHLPAENELFVDIDDTASMDVFDAMGKVLVDNNIEMTSMLVSRSRNGGTHVRIRLPFTVTPIERIAWQAVLGSDRKRELLSLLRIHLKTERAPTVFFEQPGALS